MAIGTTAFRPALFSCADPSRSLAPAAKEWPRHELSRAHAFSAKRSARLVSILAHFGDFRVKGRIFGMTFCRARFVFIHIVGSTFLFNIFFMTQSPFSTTKSPFGSCQNGALCQSTVQNQPPEAIFHPWPESQMFVPSCRQNSLTSSVGWARLREGGRLMRRHDGTPQRHPLAYRPTL